jgi:hypothetical protein
MCSPSDPTIPFAGAGGFFATRKIHAIIGEALDFSRANSLNANRSYFH